MLTRHQEIKALLLELKTHLKASTGDVRKDAAAYFAPKVAKKKTKRKTKRNAK